MALTINPNDTPDAVMRRYVAVYGDDAYARISDDEDEAFQSSPDRPCFRGRLLARAHALLHKAEGRDRFGNLPEPKLRTERRVRADAPTGYDLSAHADIRRRRQP